MAETCWFLHKPAGQVPSPSLGLIFPTGTVKGWLRWLVRCPLPVGNSVILSFCCSHNFYIFGIFFFFSLRGLVFLAFSHMLSKFTSELISLNAWAMNSLVLTYWVPWKLRWPFKAVEVRYYPISSYHSLPLHLPPQHQNGHYPQLLITSPRLAKARSIFPNDPETVPSRFLSISNHADFLPWVITLTPQVL